jgi:TRAP-type C4-dicarboxylate transport system permease small subunit
MTIRSLLDRFYLACAWAAAAAIAGIFILMLVQSIGRELGLQVRGADDISAWLCAASAFLGLAHTLQAGEMVRVGLWIDRLGPLWQRRVEIVVLLIASTFTGWAAWAVADFVRQSREFNELTQGLIIVPIWMPQLSVVVGITALFIALVDELVRVVAGQVPRYRQAAAERAARGEFGESA